MKRFLIITLVTFTGLLLSACGAAGTATPENTPIPTVIADKVIIADGRLEPVNYAEMAFNVPLGYLTYEWDEREDHFAVKMNTDLVSQVSEFAGPDDTLLVMCRSGGRSAMAVIFMRMAL